MRKSRRRAVTIALKDLGWSDADLQDADRKRSKMNLEGELSTLLGETQKIKNTQNESVVGAEQMQVLAHKRRALALKREGKLEESEDEFELAKSLEIQMDELAGNSRAHTSIDGINNDDGEAVDDIFDPQLLSALKGIGWKENDIFSQMPTKGVSAKNKGLVSTSSHVHGNLGNDTARANVDKTEGSKEEGIRLEENIRAEKLKALDFKRAAKQTEALDALRRAKQLEKKLQSLAT